MILSFMTLNCLWILVILVAGHILSGWSDLRIYLFPLWSRISLSSILASNSSICWIELLSDNLSLILRLDAKISCKPLQRWWALVRRCRMALEDLLRPVFVKTIVLKSRITRTFHFCSVISRILIARETALFGMISLEIIFNIDIDFLQVFQML